MRFPRRRTSASPCSRSRPRSSTCGSAWTATTRTRPKTSRACSSCSCRSSLLAMQEQAGLPIRAAPEPAEPRASPDARVPGSPACRPGLPAVRPDSPAAPGGPRPPAPAGPGQVPVVGARRQPAAGDDWDETIQVRRHRPSGIPGGPARRRARRPAPLPAPRWAAGFPWLACPRLARHARHARHGRRAAGARPKSDILRSDKVVMIAIEL